MKECRVCGAVESRDKYEYLVAFNTDDDVYVLCEQCEDKHVDRTLIRTDSTSRVDFISLINILGNLYVFDDSIPFKELHDDSQNWIRVRSKSQLDRLCRPMYYMALDSLRGE